MTKEKGLLVLALTDFGYTLFNILNSLKAARSQ